MAINEDGVDEYIEFNITTLDGVKQESTGKELYILYKFLYQATSPFSIEIAYNLDPGIGEATDFLGSFTYTNIDTLTTGGGPFDTTSGINTLQFPASSLCSVQITLQADNSSYDGKLTAYFAWLIAFNII